MEYCSHDKEADNCVRCAETWCRHGNPKDDCAPCAAVAENGRLCKHGIEKLECGDCDSRGAFDSGERDTFSECEHGRKWADDCAKCDGENGTAPEPKAESDCCSHGVLWTKPCKDCLPSDSKADAKWWHKYAFSSCTHTPEKPVTTINGCAIYACRNQNPGDWKAVPPYHLLIDCLSDGAPALELPPKLAFLQRYAKRDDYTIGLPWDDYKTPPVDFGFWRALVKKLPAGGVLIVTCMGAHGRTGTAIAALLLAANPGMSDLEAIRQVRAGHCVKAVEAQCQRDYLKDMALKYATKAQQAAILKEHETVAEAVKVETARIAQSAAATTVTPNGLVTHYGDPCVKGPHHMGECRLSGADFNDVTT